MADTCGRSFRNEDLSADRSVKTFVAMKNIIVPTNSDTHEADMYYDCSTLGCLRSKELMRALDGVDTIWVRAVNLGVDHRRTGPCLFFWSGPPRKGCMLIEAESKFIVSRSSRRRPRLKPPLKRSTVAQLSSCRDEVPKVTSGNWAMAGGDVEAQEPYNVTF
ncbi:hypothetical protein PROFUN_09347 [Planoprotostelium fungivorum]|uniref:Uncharacterized protein n=1 Tax=Planoprotostelium fungivorum TaxID=1890364 RepID=A0A2P6NGV2_9EUKA|nr:hypothetical protein PROFUN_09347 [Planoprotostelium fungivorum]